MCNIVTCVKGVLFLVEGKNPAHFQQHEFSFLKDASASSLFARSPLNCRSECSPVKALCWVRSFNSFLRRVPSHDGARGVGAQVSSLAAQGGLRSPDPGLTLQPSSSCCSASTHRLQGLSSSSRRSSSSSRLQGLQKTLASQHTRLLNHKGMVLEKK
ncbi:unnamed protein product [Pleuronectes platessa]|uniref:Uncharacterized protein n=1 Tax=Pleuronectes platessa TaxID=8262 RepID=A0A9N7UJG7_PLEPL|nr:unnamed protein product [Pleuronectes platessa]